MLRCGKLRDRAEAIEYLQRRLFRVDFTLGQNKGARREDEVDQLAWADARNDINQCREAMSAHAANSDGDEGQYGVRGYLAMVWVASVACIAGSSPMALSAYGGGVTGPLDQASGRLLQAGSFPFIQRSNSSPCVGSRPGPVSRSTAN